MRSEGRRHRLSGSTKLSNGEKQKKLKSFALKILFVILFAAASLTIMFVPTTVHHDHVDVHSPRSSQKWQQNVSNPLEDRLVKWLQNSPELTKLKDKLNGQVRIGFFNFRASRLDKWSEYSGGISPIVFDFQQASHNISWSDLFPEWIDEENQWNTPKCPSLPLPAKKQGVELDLVVTEVSCDKTGRNWSRDVNRLHKFLAAAKVASDSGRHHMHIVVSDECRPTPNLFTCNDLVERREGIWLYNSQLKRLRQKLSLPVGSCELALSLEAAEKLGVHHRKKRNSSREAYVTILHSAQFYVCGAITLAQSIRMTGSKRDLVILVDETIQPQHREGLQAAGWKVREIQRIRNPKAEPESYNEWNYSKFRLWQLIEYDKLIFVDADIIILRNMDFLFDMPQISATGNHESLFNSGVMVIEPSTCTFDHLLEDINEVESYNGGDQGYLNEVYTWWHRIPRHMNFLKHFGINETEELQHRLDLFAAEPPKLYAMHYLGLKPWLCFRDYDCNWNVKKLHEYANDGVHARWWKIHDRMPNKLRYYCLLRSKQKAALEWDRRQAEAEHFEDGHWKTKIRDTRLKTCFEEFCYWESMLWHWGEPVNDTSTSSVNATRRLL